MLENETLYKIAEENNLKNPKFSRLTGGDINDVFLINSEGKKQVVKINNSEKFPGMFEAEKAGLEALQEPGVIDIPKVLNLGDIGETAYLLLEFKESSAKSSNFWKSFGKQMAALHKTTSAEFGFHQDNYIGSLPQQNNRTASAADFYISERLEPQLKLAKDKGYGLGVQKSFFKNISAIIPDEKPALIHGDLWGGNYLVNAEGNPCLIDPATAFAPREMDLAMMKLFGGFDKQLFEVYDQEFPLESGFIDRIPLWQLYYLLVHLNLFGVGYKPQVTSIIKQFN
ncbi:fructosamine kinase family protein [Salegentibacter sp. JZCK2]|uniref:fructosamine kinase family protein n=1 Tax=Salegentibacter tibetensis TaxID=2873600 RepID=UPI001CCB143E|nr:fructosamine kinase family protein [Salegentibacter tibetensis]MBZ9728283.1 fructosamine kinase family protein [Salegentibacter tibetensis]